MASFDLSDLSFVADLFLVHWRFAVSTLVGIGLGLAVYYLADGSTSSAVLGSLIASAGVIHGVVWTYRHEK